MGRTFKYSTFVAKLLIFSALISSIFLASTKAQAASESDKLTLGSVRLSLWYTGVEGKSVSPSAKYEGLITYPEELDRALINYKLKKEEAKLEDLPK